MEDYVGLESSIKDHLVNKFLKSLIEQKVKKDYYQRISIFLKMLNKPKINIVCLRSCSFRGIPNQCFGLRGIIWRLLLKYLPLEVENWERFLEEKHAEYKLLCKKYELKLPVKKLVAKSEITNEQELSKEIKADIKRTKQEVDFFSIIPGHSIEECKEEINKSKDDNYDFIYNNDYSHRLVMAQMLYLYANINPSVGYVQGMNEILAIIYYCLYNDSGKEFDKYNENDIYFCFTNLMEELKTLYFKETDLIANGLKDKAIKITNVIKRVDPEFWSRLEKSNADILLFTIRWIMLLFAQDMTINNTMRLWDSILGDSERFLFFDYFIAELLIEAKESLVKLEVYEFNKALGSLARNADLYKLLINTGNMLAKDLKKDNYIGDHY